MHYYSIITHALLKCTYAEEVYVCEHFYEKTYCRDKVNKFCRATGSTLVVVITLSAATKSALVAAYSPIYPLSAFEKQSDRFWYVDWLSYCVPTHILWRSAYRIVCCNDNDAKHHYCLKSHTDRLTDCLTFYIKNVKARHMKWTRHKAGIISQTISLFRLYTYLSLTAWIKNEHGQFIKFWFLMVVQ